MVRDSYRWLEDDNSLATKEWVNEQNILTHSYLSKIPYRDKIKGRLMELNKFSRYGMFQRVRDYYYFTLNDGTQNQAILYRCRDFSLEHTLVLDPNVLSSEAVVAISEFSFSPCGKFLAYLQSEAGSDWSEIRVLDLESLKVKENPVSWVKFSAAVWRKDSTGFYYSAYDEPVKGEELTSANGFEKVCFYDLNSSASTLIYSDKDNEFRYYHPFLSDDNEHIFISVSEGTHGNEILCKSSEDADFKTIISGFECDNILLGCNENSVFVMTNSKADNYKIIALDLKSFSARDLVAEREDMVLESALMVGDNLLLHYLYNAHSKLFSFNILQGSISEIEIDDSSSVVIFDTFSDEVFFSVFSYLTPSRIYSYGLKNHELSLVTEAKCNFRKDDFVSKQLFFTASDNKQVSMFVMHRKDLTLNGLNPLYLYGYGGFNISLTPLFRPLAIAIIEQGGVFVEVNLRGGGEYGDKWHKAGMKENKQRVFDDFIDTAEFLIDKGYTSAKKLAIAGASNGGLLVGACMLQRPDLFAVALPSVGVLDMLRYHKFTVGWGWVVEYGSSDNAQDFEYLIKYSPLHNVKKGVDYPACLITTSDHDDRVVPAHSFKFAATLQSVKAEKPQLIRIEKNAGHGAGKPLSKVIDEQADVLSFMFKNTNTNYI